MKNILLIVLLTLPFGILFAQEVKPCVEYKHPKNSYSINDPKTPPIFPGCESFKENFDSLNFCTRNFIASRIAEKMDMVLSPVVHNDSTKFYYKVSLLIDIEYSGKLELKIKDKKQNKFENDLQEVLNEISDETVGITPGKMENGECIKFKYSLPILFDLTDSEYSDLNLEN